MEYSDLITEKILTEKLVKSFGENGLGIILIKNIPNYPQMRMNLLNIASKFANSKYTQDCVHEESCYLFGWSHGKEIMNGVADDKKGSYYNNPVHESNPLSEDPSYLKKYPEYGFPNVWPKEMPELKEAFTSVF